MRQADSMDWLKKYQKAMQFNKGESDSLRYKQKKQKRGKKNEYNYRKKYNWQYANF